MIPKLTHHTPSPAIDSLLDSLRTLNEKVGTHDDDEGFRMLEEMLRSNTFKKAKEVTVLSCNRQPVPRLCSSVLFPARVALSCSQAV